MKRATDEEILGVIEQLAQELANIETAMDELLCACKVDTREFRELYEKHLRLFGIMQGLRWVLGFVKYKDL